ncbi:uncharacterized protein LOC132259515 [Phlebotomus argentipes]|uniref:uncharacterized protein LOC132259515 n=1 Tax=Phlebotomus argentipes TaxID=94469 RepID=UPI0028931B62|nr:uncharacterized protein LOC132259515 [Phlebotomus argentipes]
MKIKFLILIIYCTLCAIEGRSKGKQQFWNNPNQMAFDSVPIQEQNHFITLHLALGLNERAHATPFDPTRSAKDKQTEPLELPQDINLSSETYQTLRAISTPEDFSMDLLDWTEGSFTLSDDEIHQMVVKNSVCRFEGRQCITPGDVGQACCPF